MPGSAVPTPPDIAVPKGLLPSDGRFGSGPSKIRPEAVAALAALGGRDAGYLGTSHRQAPVRNVVRRVREGVAGLFSLPEGYEVVLGNGGSTAFFDVAAFCLVEHRSQHLSFGEFSSKFAATVAVAPFLEDPHVIESEPGTHPKPFAGEGIDTYALTHNETSTGVQMEIARPRNPSGGVAPGIVVVDGTSAAGGLRVDPGQFDAYYFAPQKCLGSEGGLWVACLSPEAVARSEQIAASGRYTPAFLDLNLALANSRLDQTYNTPALSTLLLLALQLEWFNSNGGLDFAASRSEASAVALYSWAERSAFAEPFVQKPDERSRVVGTIDFDEAVPAATVAAVLRANGVVDTEGYRKLGRNQLRIALFPTIEPSDVEALTACIDHVVERL
ncbi:MAG: phosphoserine transaminase [Acidimicrobiales bacterium]